MTKEDFLQIESSQRQHDQVLLQDMLINNEYELQAYRVYSVLKLKHSADGNQHCLLLGANLQEGFVGFGYSFHLAMLNFYEDIKNGQNT